MSGPVPRGGFPSPPAAVAQGEAGARIAVPARVLGVAAEGTLVAAGRARWLLVLPRDAPALQAGSTLRLDTAGAGHAPGRAARLLAIDGRALERPLAVELRPAPGRADAQAPQWQNSGRAVTAAPQQLPAPTLPGAWSGGAGVARPDGRLAARLLQLLHPLEAGAGATPGREARERPTGAAAELARRGQEPLTGGWRLHVWPFGAEQEVRELRVWLRGDEGEAPRRDRKQRSPRGEEPPRRAIFEVELGRLGRCQIDVLCRAARFDLLLRTAAPLGVALRREIVAIFEAARETGGLSGGIGFRSGELLPLPLPRSPGAQRITV